MIDASTLNLPALEQQYGLPSGLLNAVMQTESGGNPSAVSPAGAQGLFQFMPATAEQYNIDPNDPQQAARGAAQMYGDLSKKYNGDLPSMLAAYNWGQGNLDRQGLDNAPAETKNYINNISKGLQVADSGQTASDALPEGFVLDSTSAPLPDGFVLDKAPEASKDGFVSNVKEDLAKRGENAKDILAATATGQQSIPEGMIQGAGQLAGAGWDTLGEGIRAITPDAIAKPLAKAANYVSDSALGDVARQYAGEYQGWSKENPRLSRDINAVANLAGIAPASKAVGATGTALEDIGKAATAAGDAQINKGKSGFVQDLVAPKQTPAVKVDQVKRTTESGRFNRKTIQPSVEEKQIASEVAKLPVSNKNTVQGNYNVISLENAKEAESLKDRLIKNDVSFPRQEFDTHLNTSIANLSQNPLLTGDAEATAQRIVDKFQQIAQGEKSSASGVLEARKKLDKWISQQKGQAAFDPAKENAISAATREIRNAANSFIAAKVPSVAVKESLRKQNLLYKALDNIAPKAAEEAPTAGGRLVQRLDHAIPVKSSLGKVGVLAGGTAAGSALLALAPAAVVGGATIYGAQKALRSAGLKKAVGGAIKGTGNALKYLGN